jgi:hypothetical protein
MDRLCEEVDAKTSSTKPQYLSTIKDKEERIGGGACKIKGVLVDMKVCKRKKENTLET